MPDTEVIEVASKTLLPRRGSTGTMNSTKGSIVLEKGEFFIEYPNSGVGTKGAYKIKLGDGVTAYKDLPAAFGDVSDLPVTLPSTAVGEIEGTSAYATAMNTVVTGSTTAEMISGLKTVAKENHDALAAHESNANVHVTAEDKARWNGSVTPTKLTTNDLDELTTYGATFYADPDNTCSHKPDGVDAFGLNVDITATGHVVQELTEDNGDHAGRKWIRTYSGANWTYWQYLYSSVDKPELVAAADKATKDAKNQVIDSTYIKGVSNTDSVADGVTTHTITLTKGNDATSTVAIQDVDTTYTVGLANDSAEDNVKVEVAGSDNNSTSVAVKGDKGSKTKVTDGALVVETDYTLTAVNADPAEGQTDSMGVDLKLTDIHNNVKTVKILGDEAGAIVASGPNEITISTGSGDVDVSRLKGVIAVANLPAAAMERCVTVVSNEARFALTKDDVQNGDTVKVAPADAPAVMYMVIDDTKLDTEAGYTSYTADKAQALANPVAINGTDFDGSAPITTAKWGTARNVKISDADGTNVSSAVSVDGSVDRILLLPDTIKANINGNVTGNVTGNVSGAAGKLATPVNINGTAFDGSADITTTKWGTARSVTVTDADGTNTGDATSVDGSGNVALKLPAAIKANVTGDVTGNVSGSAATLATARTINGTAFDGSKNITTSQWGTARNLSVSDADGTNTGDATSVNGSGDAVLKLPAAIKANVTGDVTGNVSGSAATLATARTINGTAFDGSANITTTKWGTARNLSISDADGTNTGDATSVDGSAAKIIKLPSTIKANITGDLNGKLSTARAIDGVNFDASADISHYGVCSTASGTAAKTVACAGFTLVAGARITVMFNNTDTSTAATLNVNSTGAKPIKLGGSNITPRRLLTKCVYEFVYDGTNFNLITGYCAFFDGGDEG